ncbi:MAG TPA: multicopper oxidase domain-containing protein, partial [Anaerolineales bacterium]|nr:multicopper oxidase domain-containing protein [Anaerolineales bacterium]
MPSRPSGPPDLSRRDFLMAGLLGGGATAVAAAALPRHDHASHDHSPQGQTSATATPEPMEHGGHGDHGGAGTVGEVDPLRNGFDPHAMLQDWDFGQTSELPGGRTLREYRIVAVDKEFEVAPGVTFPGWVYNGRVPGPTLRCVEGDHIRIEFFNGSSHPHTIHFHGIHPASMDGVPGVGAGMIPPGGSTVYEFDAYPFGCHLYHCHASPLKRHIHKGLYGAFIIDPDPARHPEQAAAARSRRHGTPENAVVNEMVMVMNAF